MKLRLLILLLFASNLYSQYLPSDDPALELWLVANDFTEYHLETISSDWPDRSRNKNDASAYGTPTLVKNLLKHNKGVYFNDDDYFLGKMDTLKEFSAYIFCSASPTASYAGIFTVTSVSDKYGWTLFSHNNEDYKAQVQNGETLVSMSVGASGAIQPGVISLIRDSDGLYTLNNESGTDTTTLAWDKSNYDDYGVGMMATLLSPAQNFHEGHIYEIVIFGRAHDGQERLEVTDYLNAKYLVLSDSPVTDELQLHLVADDLGGVDSSVIVDTWIDNSGNRNDAEVNTGSPRIRLGSINGHNSILLNDSNGDSFISADIKITENFTIFVVVRATNTALRGYFVHENAAQSSTQGFSVTSGGIRFYPSALYGGNPNIDSTWAIIALTGVSDDSSYVVYKNGTLVSTVTNRSHVSGALGDVVIGKLYADGSTDYPMAGEISEVLYYSKFLFASERTLVREYLNDKYETY